MASYLVQSRTQNPIPLNLNAEPFNPSLKCLLPHQFFHLPPPLQQLVPPSPAVVVMGMPIERGAWWNHNRHVYQHFYQFSPLPMLQYAGFDICNPKLVHPPQLHPTTKPSAFPLKTGIICDGHVGGDVKVPMDERVVKQIDGGGNGGSVGETLVKKVESAKRVVSGGRTTRKLKDYRATVWVPKKIDGQQNGERAILKPPAVEVNDRNLFSRGETTVMMRNIPNKLRREQLLEILDHHCRQENEKAKKRSDPVWSAYDFVYLPIDFRLLGNKGYAFVNFTASEGAARLQKAMNKCKWDDYMESRKECDFSVARIQGKEALVNHFQNSQFPTSSKAFLPVVLLPPRDGSYPLSAPRVVGKCV